MTHPTIEVITMWYNESFLAPFFLRHYSFADHIRVIDDAETTDNTREIVSQYPNATLEYITFPDKFDNDIAVEKMNKCYNESKYDWVIGVDADEFVLTPNLHEFLKDREEDVFLVNLNEVYRHDTEKDLDISIPIMEQRRHGIPGVMTHRHWGIKPIVVRTGRRKWKSLWLPGQHMIWNRHLMNTGKEILVGAHWMLADPSPPFIERRIRGKLRQSKHNTERGLSHHCDTMTLEKVMSQLEAHRNDARVL